MRGCKARRVSDQMSCDHCGLLWDVNDPDQPTCQIGFIDCTNNEKCLEAGAIVGEPVEIENAEIETSGDIAIVKHNDHDTELENINRILNNENNGS